MNQYKLETINFILEKQSKIYNNMNQWDIDEEEHSNDLAHMNNSSSNNKKSNGDDMDLSSSLEILPPPTLDGAEKTSESLGGANSRSNNDCQIIASSEVQIVNLGTEFEIVKTPTDGNCFFHSVIVSLSKNKEEEEKYMPILQKNRPKKGKLSERSGSFSSGTLTQFQNVCSTFFANQKIDYILRRVCFYVMYQALFGKIENFINNHEFVFTTNNEKLQKDLIKESLETNFNSISIPNCYNGNHPLVTQLIEVFFSSYEINDEKLPNFKITRKVMHGFLTYFEKMTQHGSYVRLTIVAPLISYLFGVFIKYAIMQDKRPTWAQDSLYYSEINKTKKGPTTASSMDVYKIPPQKTTNNEAKKDVGTLRFNSLIKKNDDESNNSSSSSSTRGINNNKATKMLKYEPEPKTIHVINYFDHFDSIIKKPRKLDDDIEDDSISDNVSMDMSHHDKKNELKNQEDKNGQFIDTIISPEFIPTNQVKLIKSGTNQNDYSNNSSNNSTTNRPQKSTNIEDNQKYPPSTINVYCNKLAGLKSCATAFVGFFIKIDSKFKEYPNAIYYIIKTDNFDINLFTRDPNTSSSQYILFKLEDNNNEWYKNALIRIYKYSRKSGEFNQLCFKKKGGLEKIYFRGDADKKPDFFFMELDYGESANEPRECKEALEQKSKVIQLIIKNQYIYSL